MLMPSTQACSLAVRAHSRRTRQRRSAAAPAPRRTKRVPRTFRYQITTEGLDMDEGEREVRLPG